MRNNPSLSEPGPATFKQRSLPKFPQGKGSGVKTSHCVWMIKKTKWVGGRWVAAWVGCTREVSYSRSTASLWWCDLPEWQRRLSSLIPAPLSHENSALLNFMKGLAVQFMSLPAEDMSVQRQEETLQHCIRWDYAEPKSFTPDSTFSLASFWNANIRHCVGSDHKREAVPIGLQKKKLRL